MIPIDDRISFYIGDHKPPFTTPNNYIKGYDTPICINLPTYKHNYHTIHPGTAYPVDIARLSKYSTKANLWAQCGDSPYIGPNYPVLVKIRDTHNPDSKGVLASLESPRHWGDLFKHKDMDWYDKRPDFIWRGADTNRRGTRLSFVKRFHQEYNIGFSHYVQNSNEKPGQYLAEYLKGHVDIGGMLKYKYLPVVDGNDKSSALGWILASNSIPIMPRPRFHSWLCEPWLESGKHYIECLPDFSDLLERVAWCKDHDQECSEIAENGTKFMLQFMNPMTESFIEKKIIEYINEH
tara:strand:+ start:2673 stop:3551 length:879 start_codon:yes stop_codon:yes gene_type:complete